MYSLSTFTVFKFMRIPASISEFESPIDRSLGFGTPSKSVPIKTEEAEIEFNK